MQIIDGSKDCQICGSVEAGQASGQVMSPRLARTLAFGPLRIDGSKLNITVKRNGLISSWKHADSPMLPTHASH